MKIVQPQSHLTISVCEDAHEAIREGYIYREPAYKPIKINKVVVVKEGTMGGNSTVDLILEDETGQKYVALLTSQLLKTIPAFGPGHE